MARFISILFICCLSQIMHAQERSRKAVFVIVDGVPADLLAKANTPYLNIIAKKGRLIPAYVGGEKGGYSQTPTISAPGYNDLLTGTWGYKHNVWGNDISAPNYNYWNVFRIVKTVAPDKKLAIFSTWLDNRTKLIGEGLKQAGNIQLNEHYDGLELDTVRFPQDTLGEFYHLIDESVVEKAAESIQERGPDLSWVYLEYTDEMGHRHGDSPQMFKAVEYADKQIGRLLEAIQYRMNNFPEDWAIFITTDHGRDAIGGHDHGGQSDRERNTWIVTNAKEVNTGIYPRRAGIIDITPTILKFMKIKAPRPQQMELDGKSLTGRLSVDEPMLQLDSGWLSVKWKTLDPAGMAKVWVSTTNNFAKGGTDDYKLLATLPVNSGKAKLDVRKMPSKFYKVVIEGPYNMVNRWYEVKK